MDSQSSLDEIQHRLSIISDRPELSEYTWLKYEFFPDRSFPPQIIVIKPFISFGYGFFSTPGTLSDLMIMKRFEHAGRMQLYGVGGHIEFKCPFEEYLKGKRGFVIVYQTGRYYDSLIEYMEQLARVQEEIFRKLPKVIITKNPQCDEALHPDYQFLYNDDSELFNTLSGKLFKEVMKGIFLELLLDSHGSNLKLSVFIDFETNPPHQGWNDFDRSLYEAACKGYGDFVLVSRDEQKVTVDSLRLRITMPFFNGLLSGRFIDSGSKRYQTELPTSALNVLHQLLYNQLGSLYSSDRHANQVSDYLDVLAFLHQHMCVNERMLYITTNYLVHNFQRWPNFTEVYQFIFDDPKSLPPEVSGYTSWLSRVQSNFDQLGSYLWKSDD